MSGIDWSATPAAYSIDREQLDALLSMPCDEPDMADVERVCDEVRHEVPITDPRWLVSTQPDREPIPPPLTHWMIQSGLPMPQVLNACGAPSGSKANSIANQVTCPACLDAVVRTKCLTMTPGDLTGLGVVCQQKVGADGTHVGPCDWDKPLSSPLTDHERAQALARDTPSGRLPVRTPGAALRDEEGSDGPGGPGESARPGESILGRRVIERWPA